MESLLATIIAALFDAVGEAMVRAACDRECAIRKGRAEATAKAEAAFGPLPPDPMPPDR